MPVPVHQALLNGITCIDTGYCRPAMAACYLMEHNGQAAFVDTGTTHTVPRLLALLNHKNIAPQDVAYVMPTHVHLDHAGGAGELMHHLPNARLVVHPRGAKHLVDPGKLTAGATAVYGEAAFKANFGELRPVPKERVILADDGLELDLNGRRLLFLDTPGHARHHYSIFDETSQAFFTGDIFGLSYRQCDGPSGAFVFPTTTPVQFDPQAWHRSLDLLMSYRPERIFLTHYGMVTGVETLAKDLHRRIDQLADIATASVKVAASADWRRRIAESIGQFLIKELAVAGAPLSPDEALALFRLDIDLNAQGLEIWLTRKQASRQ
ncbi:MAG: MBL fold metallo-hydrolase [Gammaproteobacteria bacterium]